MSCDKPTRHQYFQRTGTIPPYKSCSQSYQKLIVKRQYSHQNLFESELSFNEERLYDLTQSSRYKKKNGISGKIANRKKPRRRPTSHVVADEEMTKQVMRSASVVYHADEQCTSQRSLSVPTSTADVLVTDKELKKLAEKYQKGVVAEASIPPPARRSFIPVLKNALWRRPSCKSIEK